MSSTQPPRKPWPMKWILAAILLFVGGYTYVTLHYRKPNRPYEPYANMKERANTSRLLAAGYQRIELPISRPSDATPAANTAMPAPGGLPQELRSTLVSAPLLPLDVVDVHAAAVIPAAETYTIRFRCLSPDDRQQLGSAAVYIKADEIVITPDFARLDAGLQARSRETVATVTLPAGALKPGSYRVTLAGQQTSRAWILNVR